MTTLIFGLLVFLGVHSVSIVGAEWRNRVARTIGVATWQGIYSLIALAGLILIVLGYAAARQSPVVVYAPPTWLRETAIVLLIPVFPLLLAAYLPGSINTKLRNNALLTATKLWAVSHLLANGTLADLLLFGSILAWAAAVRVSLKYRVPRPVPSLPATRYNDAVAVTAGLALYVAFAFGGHAWLIGVPAYPAWL